MSIWSTEAAEIHSVMDLPSDGLSIRICVTMTTNVCTCYPFICSDRVQTIFQRKASDFWLTKFVSFPLHHQVARKSEYYVLNMI